MQKPSITTKRHRLIGIALSAAILATLQPLRGEAPQAPSAETGSSSIQEADVRRWLTDLSSDAMEGRRVFTEGYGLAAAYVAAELQKMGAKPMGADGGYLQPVALRRYRVTRASTVTVEVAGERRVFSHGEHVTFPDLTGGPQKLTFSNVEFAGYGRTGVGGTDIPNDFRSRDVQGRLVVWMPEATGGRGGGRGGRLTAATRSTYMIQTLGAGAAVSFAPAPAAAAAPSAPEPPGGRGGTSPEITTVERVDRPRAAVLTGDEAFFEFLFSRSTVSFAELRERAANGRPLEAFALPNATVSIDLADTYEVTSTEFTHNVVALVEGSDPLLKDQYIFFGAHLDHVGYATGPQPRGRVNTPVEQDRIWNGADDDGSGSSALLGLAKAFVNGPRPRRSVVFVWHAGEEQNLLGSRYMADAPVVPLEAIQAQINVDMIGRNRDDNPDEADTLYVIGADRISTGLHNAIVRANASFDRPLRLDFEYNDPADPNSFYTRSDHYSYATKDIPIAFFFTGTHADYHANTDTVDKILFPKLLRVTALIYRAGWNLANDPVSLVRDRRGPRAGKGFRGLIEE